MRGLHDRAAAPGGGRAVPGLAEHQFPDRKEKILDRIRAMRGGRLNDSRFGVRMSGEGRCRDDLADIPAACRRAGLNQRPWPVSAAAFRRPRPRSGSTAPAVRVSKRRKALPRLVASSGQNESGFNEFGTRFPE